MLSSNSILQDRYRIVRLLGEGGMGAVYEAIDQRVSCLVALKQTLVEDDEMRSAFRREAALLANLRHPALPKVMDYFGDDDGQFLVMEYVPGHDLAELLALRGGPFPPDDVFRWADELLRLLEFLHSRRPPILHRDIKPANLKLTKQGEIFLLDFGLAKGSLGQMTTLQTSKSVRAYTPVYSPLEQIHGKGTDQRSDLYALGATLYQLLTGKSPVDAPTRFAAVDDDLPDPLQSVHDLNPDIFPRVSDVVKQAMAIRRRGRFDNAAAMRNALLRAREQWLEADEETRKSEAAARAELERETQLQHEAERRRKEQAERAAEELRQQQLEEEQRRLTQQRREREERARREKEQETRARLEIAARAAEELKQRQAQEAQQLRAQQLREQEEQARREEAETRARIEAAERAKREEEDPELTRPAIKDGEQPGATKRSPPSPGQVLAPTVRGPSARETNREESAATAQKPPPIKTIRVPYSEVKPAPSGPDTATPSVGLNGKTRTRRNWILLIFGAVTLVAGTLVIAGLYLWLSQRTTANGPVNLNQPVTQSPSNTPQNLPQIVAPTGMAYVPGGQFMMGRNDGDQYERPAHQVAVKPLFMDIYEVTNQQYQEFVNKTGHNPPEHWTKKQFPDGKGQLPVTNVSWDDANAYAKWAGKRLPTEAEWEFGARGTDGRRYPWGNDWQEGLANVGNPHKIGFGFGLEGLSEVGQYKGASPFGLVDMVGNAWEWTADKLTAYPGGHIPNDLPGVEKRVIRGGSFGSDKASGVTLRRGYPARGPFLYQNTGFRCVKDLN